MTTDQQLFKDVVTAAQILQDLETKDKNEDLCRYPICREPRQETIGSGRPSAYCANTEHNAVSSHRARQLLRVTALGTTNTLPAEEAKRESPPLPSITNVESLRGSVLNAMTLLQNTLERYVSILIDISDPDISVAQIQATQDRADTRIAEAQQLISTERSLRLASDAAMETARKEAQAEREAAEQAIQQLEEIEARSRRQLDEAERQIAETISQREAMIDQLRNDLQREKATIEAQANETVMAAQAATTAALEQTRTAREQARISEEQARTRTQEAQSKVETANQLVTEARASLDREREEVNRLRQELVAERTEAQANLDRERGEVNRLRQELATERVEARKLLDKFQADARSQTEAERAEARATLERERGEIDRLRQELASARLQTEQAMVRADQLVTQLTQTTKIEPTK